MQQKKYLAGDGILQTAKWITHPRASENTLAFEKNFSGEGVLSARLFICGLGFFQAFLNGKGVDERYFMPAFTDYEKRDICKNPQLLIGQSQRVFAHTYDVTKFLQGENVLPLAYGIVPKPYIERLQEKVRRKYAEETAYHLDTGIVATPIVVEYLTENGMADVVYRMLTAVDYPSYADMLKGETTLPEHWSKRWPDYHVANSDEVVKGGGHLSHCHPMFGAIIAWMYKRVAGLDLSSLYQGRVCFAPRFTKWIKEASATVETAFGVVKIAWEKRGKFTADIHIPQGLEGWFELDLNEPLTMTVNGGQKCRYLPQNGKVKIPLSRGDIHISE